MPVNMVVMVEKSSTRRTKRRVLVAFRTNGLERNTIVSVIAQAMKRRVLWSYMSDMKFAHVTYLTKETCKSMWNARYGTHRQFTAYQSASTVISTLAGYLANHVYNTYSVSQTMDGCATTPSSPACGVTIEGNKWII